LLAYAGREAGDCESKSIELRGTYVHAHVLPHGVSERVRGTVDGCVYFAGLYACFLVLLFLGSLLSVVVDYGVLQPHNSVGWRE
jgi:hypothetical protein